MHPACLGNKIDIEIVNLQGENARKCKIEDKGPTTGQKAYVASWLCRNFRWWGDYDASSSRSSELYHPGNGRHVRKGGQAGPLQPDPPRVGALAWTLVGRCQQPAADTRRCESRPSVTWTADSLAPGGTKASMSRPRVQLAPLMAQVSCGRGVAVCVWVAGGGGCRLG